MAGECIKFCYARKGYYKYPNPIKAHEKRYQISKQDDFVELMNKEINSKQPDYVRVHDAGDYYSTRYLNKWIAIAIHNPNVRFYSYTNNVEMLKKANLPDNYDIIFSTSGKQKDMVDYANDRHSRIFSDRKLLSLNGYVDCSETDLYATKWFSNNKKAGLIMH